MFPDFLMQCLKLCMNNLNIPILCSQNAWACRIYILHVSVFLCQVYLVLHNTGTVCTKLYDIPAGVADTEEEVEEAMVAEV